MKHQKEWHTCDRCGAEIKVKPITELKFTRLGDYLTPSPIFEDGDIRGEIHTCNLLFWNRYDLCLKCRKDFVRFMRNEKND